MHFVCEKDCYKYTDIPYGTHERNILDLIIPKNPVKKEGVILYIHGGGWVSCDKSAHTADIIYRSEKGFISAAVNYRYVNEDIHTEHQLDDITKALLKIKEVCSQHGISLKKVLLAGGSAGAHLSLMYAFTRKEEAPLTPVAVTEHCGPTDFSKLDFLLGKDRMFEDWKYEVLSFCCGKKISKDNFLTESTRELLKKYSPVTYAGKNTLPVLIGHGNGDTLVPINQSYELREILLKNNVRCDFIIYKNADHDLKGDNESEEKMKELSVSYAEKYL